MVIKKELCSCGKEMINHNLYRIETWRYSDITKGMELIYAQCFHGDILINKYLGEGNAINKER
jgi:hypothetical protein